MASIDFGRRAGSLRVAVVRVAIIVIFFLSVVFLFVFFLVGLLAKNDIGCYGAISAVSANVLWIHSVHGQWYAVSVTTETMDCRAGSDAGPSGTIRTEPQSKENRKWRRRLLM